MNPGRLFDNKSGRIRQVKYIKIATYKETPGNAICLSLLPRAASAQVIASGEKSKGERTGSLARGQACNRT